MKEYFEIEAGRACGRIKCEYSHANGAAARIYANFKTSKKIRNSRGEHLLLLFASAECRSLCILHMKLQFLTSGDLLRQAKDPNLQKANKQKTLNVSFIHKSNSKLENKIYGPPCIGENYTKSNYIVKLGLV